MRLELKGIATNGIAELIYTFAGHLSMLQITAQMSILVAIEAAGLGWPRG